MVTMNEIQVGSVVEIHADNGFVIGEVISINLDVITVEFDNGAGMLKTCLFLIDEINSVIER